MTVLNYILNIFCALPPWPSAIFCLSLCGALFRFLLERKASDSQIGSKE